MSSFAIYRLPHADHCIYLQQTHGRPEQLSSCEQLNGRTGFVFAPFHISQDHPLLLITPDKSETIPVSQLGQAARRPCVASEWFEQSGQSLHPASSDNERACYRQDFNRFLQQLSAGTFQKLVLARCAVMSADHEETPMTLFQRACERYPRLFVALVGTPQSGMWLVATPEILLEGQARQWRTIALAGTMQLTGEALNFDMPPARQADNQQPSLIERNISWSTKNIQEQRYVATYMAEQLKPFASQLLEEGPRTVRAANLVHLRSDFTFTLYNNARAGDLLQALHPTPAVCGLPKQQAFDFILQNEHTPRRYYSGFMGPFGEDETHLYVTLRCMQIDSHAYRLYAGGGLLKDSLEEQEWQETEAKMETMRAIIAPHRPPIV